MKAKYSTRAEKVDFVHRHAHLSDDALVDALMKSGLYAKCARVDIAIRLAGLRREANGPRNVAGELEHLVSPSENALLQYRLRRGLARAFAQQAQGLKLPHIQIESMSRNDPGHEWSRVSVSWGFPAPNMSDGRFHTTEAVRFYSNLTNLTRPVHSSVRMEEV